MSKPQTKEYFNRVSSEYFHERDEVYVFNIQKRIVLRMLDTEYKDGKKIIDIGCGAGLLTRELLTRNHEVWGTDVSEEMISNANAALSDQNLDDNRVHYSLGDIEKLDFPDNYFDAVISLGVLEYLSTYRFALKEIHRVLKPFGIAIISLPTKISPYHVLYKLAEKTIIPVYQKTFKKLLTERISRADPDRNLCVPWNFYTQLTEAGFKKLENEFCIFVFYPFYILFPKLSITISKKMEKLSRSKFFGFLGTQYIIKAEKSKICSFSKGGIVIVILLSNTIQKIYSLISTLNLKGI